MSRLRWPTGRLRRVDPYGLVLAAASLAVFLIYGFQHRLKHDMALYAYAGQQLADGVPPYMGVLNRAGPLAHALPGLGALGGELLGKDELIAMRALMMVLSVGCVWLGYVLGRDLFGSRLAGMVCGSTLVAMPAFVVLAMGGPREKTTMVLFLLAALWALTRRSWLLAGGAVALATLSWQPAFFAGAAAALTAALLLPGWAATLRALVKFALSGLAVLAATVLAFAAAGALDAFYEGFLAVHLGYTTQTGIWDKPLKAFGQVTKGYGWATSLILLGLVATLVLGALRLRSPDRASARGATVVALGAGTLACIAWSGIAFQSWSDVMFTLPFVAAGLAGVAQAVRAALPERLGTRILVAVVVVLLAFTAARAWVNRPTRLADDRVFARQMVRAAGPGATLQSFGTLAPQVFTGRTNPSRYVNMVGGFDRYLDENLPGGLEGLAEDVEQRRPTLIVLADPHKDAMRWLKPTLREHYLYVGGDVSYDYWYVARSDATRIHRLRSVMRAAGVPTGRRA